MSGNPAITAAHALAWSRGHRITVQETEMRMALAMAKYVDFENAIDGSYFADERVEQVTRDFELNLTKRMSQLAREYFDVPKLPKE